MKKMLFTILMLLGLTATTCQVKASDVSPYDFGGPVGWGTVDGLITGSEDEKYYVVATPYSEHWKAYIDGTEAEAIQANIQYMAVKVPAGHHSVEFRYVGDYTAGVILSAAGVLVFAGYMICGKIRKDKKIRS